jgi:hypothetical protein
VIYVADGPNIRRITPDGIISTLIGSQEQPRDWTPMPCDDILSAERVCPFSFLVFFFLLIYCSLKLQNCIIALLFMCMQKGN